MHRSLVQGTLANWTPFAALHLSGPPASAFSVHVFMCTAADHRAMGVAGAHLGSCALQALT